MNPCWSIRINVHFNQYGCHACEDSSHFKIPYYILIILSRLVTKENKIASYSFIFIEYTDKRSPLPMEIYNIIEHANALPITIKRGRQEECIRGRMLGGGRKEIGRDGDRPLSYLPR